MTADHFRSNTRTDRKAAPMNLYTVIDSPIDELTLVATDGVLSALFMLEHTHQPPANTYGRRVGGAEARAVFGDAIDQLGEYFAGERRDFTLTTSPRGTDFQRRVWQALTEIPYGHTRTYGQIADRIGNRQASRAVGLANGRNPLSIIVPCHRVIGSTGNLTGYGGGVARKRFLLDLEIGQTAARRPMATGA
ncbi:methylated-DNA--[protein]-cysteine S-methyltransferase [Spelaeicoccus albus]|uniref:Methylated-DNA--protein-cysteine methyltransferase n=1 Tax=Spelaeicoccus albus TaxID=1280376 RepID=A0A7Z0D0T5_9MICO|nr:methylated-DNA--[protein]-cysteine S-methyltransferase [Spelaeicoccus albus]NYI65813.1 methylated-DNA-[protein]-cysteine S-methyltransferase [Spelaeicoccus albus]